MDSRFRTPEVLSSVQKLIPGEDGRQVEMASASLGQWQRKIAYYAEARKFI